MRAGLLALLAVLALAASSSAQADGQFDIGCNYSHSLRDDPIMFPGEPGASHLHDFAGFRRTDAHSEAAQMLADLRADPFLTTCTERGNEKKDPAANASGYWAPAVYVNDVRIPLDHVHIYYRSFGKPVEPFPLGFKLIVGDPTVPPEQQKGKVRWFCGSPNQARITEIPPDCDQYGWIKAEALTPTCWNGQLDSFDHRAHVVYQAGRPCPQSHQRRLPRLTVHFVYDVLHVLGRRLDPEADVLTVASGPMHTWHADYLSAWEPDRLAFLVEFCLNQGRNCKFGPPE